MDIIKRQNELIEELSVFFTEEEQLAPIEGKIFGLIVLRGKEGVTFDSIINELAISKGTASEYLKKLQSINRIEYYTKSGDRKRYFIVKKDLMSNLE